MASFRRTGLALPVLIILSNASNADNFYVIGTVGVSDASTVSGTFGARFRDISGDDSGFSLGVGYTIGRVFSVEASFQEYGELTGTRNRCAVSLCTLEGYPPESVSADAFLITAVGKFPITARFSGYGKLGFANWKFDSGSSVYDDSGNDALLGLGLKWSSEARWAVFAEYGTINIDVDTFSIGLSYGFRDRN